MLVLSRKHNESIVLDLRFCGLGVVKICVVDFRNNQGQQVRLGIDADAKIPVHRREVFDTIERARPVGMEPAK